MAPTPSLPDSAYDLTFAGPSEYEQLMVELINRARQDPLGETGSLAPGSTATPKQVMAVVPELDAAAQLHSDDMIADNFFAHTNPFTGKNPFQRMNDAGYSYRTAGENIGAIFHYINPYTADRIEGHHLNLWNSDGHQNNMLNPAFSEVGIGFATGTYTYNGTTYPQSSMLTQNFGDRGYNYLTGVVIDDQDDDEFYDLGEGQSAVRITAWNDVDTFATSTWDAGGYSLRLDPGTYTVRFEGGDLDGAFTTTVTIGSDNIKLDVIEDRDAIIENGPVYLTDANDQHEATDADDEVHGGLGNDKIWGYAGDDTLDGGDGRDVLYGGSGRDTLTGGDMGDRLVGSGGNDLAYGNDGPDTLKGGGGKDELRGGNGNDKLYGDQRFDKLYGGNGKDWIEGGGGNDRLTGNKGADSFVFRAGDGQDRIVDFTVGEDMLLLDPALWDGSMDGAAIVDQFGTPEADGLYLDFGTDGGILLAGLTDTAGLGASIDFV